jgi:hypothetical protein
VPRIVSLQPTETAVVDLGHFAWRLGIDATTLVTKEGSIPCFSLVYRYVPAQMGSFRPADSMWLPLMDAAMVPLVRLEVDFQREMGVPELQAVTRVAVTRGNFTDDAARVAEAYNLFRNGRPSIERLEACIADSTKVLRAYWDVREWIAAGMKNEHHVTALPSTTLVLMP